MTVFIEQLRLAEQAAENIYFAKLDRELIESLHKRMRPEEGALFQPAAPASQQRQVTASVLSAGTVYQSSCTDSGREMDQ